MAQEVLHVRGDRVQPPPRLLHRERRARRRHLLQGLLRTQVRRQGRRLRHRRRGAQHGEEEGLLAWTPIWGLVESAQEDTNLIGI